MVAPLPGRLYPVLVLISAGKKNDLLCTVSLCQNPRTDSDWVHAHPRSQIRAQEEAMLKLAQQSFMAIIGAENGVETI